MWLPRKWVGVLLHQPPQRQALVPHSCGVCVPTYIPLKATRMAHIMHHATHVRGGGREQLGTDRHIAKAVQHSAVVAVARAEADIPKLRLLPPPQAGRRVIAQPAGGGRCRCRCHKRMQMQMQMQMQVSHYLVTCG